MMKVTHINILGTSR